MFLLNGDAFSKLSKLEALFVDFVFFPLFHLCVLFCVVKCEFDVRIYGFCVCLSAIIIAHSRLELETRRVDVIFAYLEIVFIYTDLLHAILAAIRLSEK